MLLLGRLYNVLGVFLWQTKAMAVMLVGVGVKLALYNPMAPADAFYAKDQVQPDSSPGVPAPSP